MNDPLDAIQHVFADAIRDPQNEAALFERLSPTPGDAALRLNVYRGNAQSAWHAALASAYPVLRALTGESYFAALARAYARAHPSDSGDLNRFGAHLPAFIEGWEHDSRYDYFGDIARLEWHIHTAWYAADPAVLDAQQWQAIGSERLLASPLAIHPACVAMCSRHAIVDIWHAHQPGGMFASHIDTPSWTLVVRPQWRPDVIDQDPAAHEAFVALQRGQTLNEAIDIALAVDPAFDIRSQLQRWIGVSAITGLADLAA